MIILVYVIAAMLTFGGGCLLGYQNGKKIERVEWQEKEKKQLAELNKEWSLAIERKSSFDSAQQDNLMRIINEKNDTLDKLNNDLVYARGVHVIAKSTACPENSMQRKTKSSGESAESSSESGLRITGGIQQEIFTTTEIIDREIWRVYEEREKLKAYAKSLRGKLEPLVEVIK